MTERIGPALKEDKSGNLEPYLSCVGCKFLKFHDWHYPYCGAQVSKNNDGNAKIPYPWPGAGVHLGYPEPNSTCPHLTEEQRCHKLTQQQ